MISVTKLSGKTYSWKSTRKNILCKFSNNLYQLCKSINKSWFLTYFSNISFLCLLRILTTIFDVRKGYCMLYFSKELHNFSCSSLNVKIKLGVTSKKTVYLKTLSRLRLTPTLLPYFWHCVDYVDLPPSPKIFDKNHEMLGFETYILY